MADQLWEAPRLWTGIELRRGDQFYDGWSWAARYQGGEVRSGLGGTRGRAARRAKRALRDLMRAGQLDDSKADRG